MNNIILLRWHLSGVQLYIYASEQLMAWKQEKWTSILIWATLTRAKLWWLDTHVWWGVPGMQWWVSTKAHQWQGYERPRLMHYGGKRQTGTGSVMLWTMFCQYSPMVVASFIRILCPEQAVQEWFEEHESSVYLSLKFLRCQSDWTWDVLDKQLQSMEAPLLNLGVLKDLTSCCRYHKTISEVLSPCLSGPELFRWYIGS